MGNPGVKWQKSWKNARKLLRNVAKNGEQMEKHAGNGKNGCWKSWEKTETSWKNAGTIGDFGKFGAVEKRLRFCFGWVFSEKHLGRFGVLESVKLKHIWKFPEIGLPPNHPF